MKDGRWLEPRHKDCAIFDKDYPNLDLDGLNVRCPGCKRIVALNKKSVHNRIGGWCKDCNRAVTV